MKNIRIGDTLTVNAEYAHISVQAIGTYCTAYNHFALYIHT